MYRNMKKLFVLLLGAMAVCTCYAQVLREGESALVYYSPKTTLSLDFTYTVEKQERGIYAEYAEGMLGVTDVIKETSTVYALKDVHIGTSTSTDYNRPHKIGIESGIPMLFHINDKGLLMSYNTEPEAKKASPNKLETSSRQGTKSRINSTRVAPYPEEAMKASSPRAQAFEIAKQIYHIREARLYLLTGEVDHAPADSKAMELVLAELDKQERALTELFTGKKTRKTDHKVVRIEPTNEGHLLFFSEENGFTDGDNIDADTIQVQMVCQDQYPRPLGHKEKRKGGKPSQVVYNIPGYCDVNVNYKGHCLSGRTVPVAQLGMDVALPLSLFTGKELPKIVFSEKTGNVVTLVK